MIGGFPPATFSEAFAVVFSVAAAGHYRLYLWSFSLDSEETPNFLAFEPCFTSHLLEYWVYVFYIYLFIYIILKIVSLGTQMQYIIS